MTDKIAAIKVRGEVDARKKVRTTLDQLNLQKTNQIVIYDNESSIKGMFNQAKDYITYGEIQDEETLEQLQEKNDGQEIENGTVVDLHPPTGGYKNTRKHVNQSGSLGKRQNLDNLIQKMV